MANNQNLRPKPFTSENQPDGASKSRKGIPNRATVFKRLLNIKITDTDLKSLNIVEELVDQIKSKKVSLHEAMALGQIQSAIKGNTKAFQEIQDSLYGKIVEQRELDVRGNLDATVKIALDDEYGDDRDE